MQKVEEILLSFDPSMVVVGVVVVKCSQDLVFLFSLAFINKTEVFRIASIFLVRGYTSTCFIQCI